MMLSLCQRSEVRVTSKCRRVVVKKLNLYLNKTNKDKKKPQTVDEFEAT